MFQRWYNQLCSHYKSLPDFLLGLYLVCDCAHAGQWVMNFANFLEDNLVAACGHKAKEKGYLLKIFTSCKPEQTVKDFCFSTGAVTLESDKCLGFSNSEELSPTQTTFGKDFTKLLCFQKVHKKCQVDNLTHHWTWVDYATKQRAIIDFMYLVRGMDKGREAWYYVLVNKGCKEQFKVALSHEKINLQQHGIVVCSGYGNNPPDDIEKRIQSISSD